MGRAVIDRGSPEETLRQLLPRQKSAPFVECMESLYVGDWT